MSSTRNLYYENLEDKVAAIRAGTAENSLNPVEVIMFACAHHKNGKDYKPISHKDLSKAYGVSLSYFSDTVKDFNNGRATKLSRFFATFMANITGKDLTFWRRESFSLAEAEAIQITLPHEVKPEPTIAGPAIQNKGITTPTARDLAKAVLFPPDLNSVNIARVMKERLGPKGEPHR